MKPIHTVLLCLACSFLAAGATYGLTQMSPQPPQQFSTAPKDDSERVARLESEIGILNAKLNDLGKLQQDAPRPDSAPAKPRTDPRKDDVAPTKASGDTTKIDDLAERLKEIESGEAAARALRDKAVIDLNSGDDRKQEEAARLLGHLAKEGDEAAKKALREAMKSQDSTVREWAVEALNDTGLAEFMPELKLLMNDPEADVREEVTQTLESMPADEAGPLLISMLGDSEPDVLIGAIEVLGSLEYKAAINDLLPLTRNANEEVAISAAIAMSSCGDSSAAEIWVPTLGARLSNEDAGERRRAVRYLREMGLESSRTYLEQAKQDSDWRVRREAERALQELDEQ